MKTSNREMKAVPLTRHAFHGTPSHGEWNHTVHSGSIPEPPPNKAIRPKQTYQYSRLPWWCQRPQIAQAPRAQPPMVHVFRAIVVARSVDEGNIASTCTSPM